MKASSFTSHEVRAALRAAACQLAATIPGKPEIDGPTAEACCTGAGAFLVEFRPGDDMMPFKLTGPAPEVVAEQRRRRAVEVAILRVCKTPLKGKVIANRIGRSYDSNLRSILAAMVRKGMLRRASDGRGYVSDVTE